MKRFIAVFGIIVIITMHCLSFYPSKASITGVDYGEMLNTYLGAAETALAASQGVTIDWSNLKLPEGSDTWTNQQKAQYIVQYVGNLKNAGLRFWYDFLFGDAQNPSFDVISVETAAIGLNSSKNINTQDIKAQLDNILATQSQAHVFQRYSDKVIARWNEYNSNYINDYLDKMNITENIPTTNPDLDYISILNTINDVYWTSFLNSYIQPDHQDRTYMANYYPFYSYSYIRTDTSFSIDNNQVTMLSPLSINIVSYNDTYSFNVTIEKLNNIVTRYNTSTGVKFADYNGIRFYSDYFSGTSNQYSGSSNFSYTGTLSDVLNYIASWFRNVNIYVDGTAWSLPLYDIDNNRIELSLPDAVIDNSNDDGKIVAHPIYYPDVMDTDKAIDIDLDKVVDAIAQRIADGASDITFDDLVDAGAAVKLDGTTLTDADTVVKDVSVPIARAKVDTIDGVIPTIDIVPPLPPLPPLTPGDYSGEGFNGMSVLARIINATVQGLPKPLILTFFGVVFGAVILGIIDILHH